MARVNLTVLLSRRTEERAGELGSKGSEPQQHLQKLRAAAVLRLFLRTCVNEERGSWASVTVHEYAEEKQNPPNEDENGESAGL